MLLPIIKRYDKEIAKLFVEHEDAALFASLSGSGAALAPRLLVAFGSEQSRLEDAAEVQKWSGIAPVTRKSGRSSQVVWRRGCSKFVRQRGLKHHAAVRALAYKWIRIFFRCWIDRVHYDEELYYQSLQRSNSPLVALMQPVCG